MRYHCENCGHIFSIPYFVEENYGLPGPWKQVFLGCPACKTDAMIGVMGDETL